MLIFFSIIIIIISLKGPFKTKIKNFSYLDFLQREGHCAKLCRKLPEGLFCLFCFSLFYAFKNKKGLTTSANGKLAW